MVAFQRANYDNVAWIQRTPYWFFNYEAFFHHRTVMGMVRSLLFILAALIHTISGKLGIFLGWLLGYFVMPCTTFPKHFNPTKFNLGCLDKMQLAHVKGVQPRFAEPARFCKEGVAMKTGEVVKCDMVICATGDNTGFDTSKMSKMEHLSTSLARLYCIIRSSLLSLACLLHQQQPTSLARFVQ